MADQATADAAARLIERLLSDEAFRVRFRRNPVAACRAAGLDDVADEMAAGRGKAAYTLDLRESKTSLAGVFMAAAVEGMAAWQMLDHVVPHIEDVASGTANAVQDVLSRVNLPAIGHGAPAAAAAVPVSATGTDPTAAGGGAAAVAAAAPAPAPAALPDAATAPGAGGSESSTTAAEQATKAADAKATASAASATATAEQAADASAASTAGDIPYPGDNATKAQIAAWMGNAAQKRGLPRELPIMAALTESGLTNIQGGDRDSIGFFQMRTGIWNQGEYAGFPQRPDLQLDWFLDHAEQVKAQRLARGQPIDDPNSYGDWIADVERPAAEYRGRYQTHLAQAQGLLQGAADQPAAAPGAADATTTTTSGSTATATATDAAPATSTATDAAPATSTATDGTTAAATTDAAANGAPSAVVTTLDARSAAAVAALSGEHQLTTSTTDGGRTVDITAVDGQPIDANNIDARELAAQISQLPPDQRPTSIATPWAIGAAGYVTGPEHGAHIRLTFDAPAATAPASNTMSMATPRVAATAASAHGRLGTMTFRRVDDGPTASAASAPAPTATVADAPGTQAADAAAAAVTSTDGLTAGPKAQAAIDEAKKYLGTPYLWGGSSPKTGFDCSGLMQWAYSKAGISIPRVADQQALAANGVAVDREHLVAGDLVSFADGGGHVHHIGMYLGDGKFIHAPHTGDVVKVSSLDEPYYKAQFAGGRRFDEPVGAAAASTSAPAAAPAPAPAPAPAAVAAAAPTAPASDASAAEVEAAQAAALARAAAPPATAPEVVAAQAAVARDAAEAQRPGSMIFKALEKQEASHQRHSMAFMSAISDEQVAASRSAAAAAATAPAPAATGADGQVLAQAAEAATTPGSTGGANIVALARGELGVTEQPPGSNDSARIAEYRTAVRGAPGPGPWCAYFASWVSAHNGTPLGETGQGFARVDDVWAWAERSGRAVPAASGAAPRPGDLIVWDEHIGVVEKVGPDGTIETIEGNSGDHVAHRVYPPGTSAIVGFVRVAA